MTTPDEDRLLAAAASARAAAICPHSGFAVGAALLDSAGIRAYEVVARRKAEDTVLPAIVGLIGAGWRQLFLSADILLSQDRDDRARERLAFFVQHVTGDYPAARKFDVDIGGLLCVG